MATGFCDGRPSQSAHKLTGTQAQRALRNSELAASGGVPQCLASLLIGGSQVRGKTRVDIGDGRECEVHQRFRLVMHCSAMHPVVGSTLAGMVNVVDMATTPQGLEDQLVAASVSSEEPHLEAQLARARASAADSTAAVARLDEELLQRLAESKQSLLEDDRLVGVLRGIKHESAAAQQQL